MHAIRAEPLAGKRAADMLERLLPRVKTQYGADAVTQRSRGITLAHSCSRAAAEAAESGGDVRRSAVRAILAAWLC